MEGEKRTGGWHRRQYSRKPHCSKEYEGNERATVEGRSTNPWSNPGKRYAGYGRDQRYTSQHTSEFRTRRTRDTVSRQSDEQRNHGLVQRRTTWHSRREKLQQNDAKDEDNMKDSDEEDGLEYFTSEEGDDEEDDTQTDEAGLDNDTDLSIQIILKLLEEMKKAQNGLGDGEEDGSAEAFEPEDQQSFLEQRNVSVAGSTVADDGRRSPGFAAGSELLNFLFKCIPGLEQNILKEQQAEEPNIQLPVTEILKENHAEIPSIQFPIPRNYGGHHWSVNSARRFELGNTGYSYEGQVNDQKMHGFGRLTMGDGGDIIVGNWEENRLVELDSCKLHYRKNTFRIIKRAEDYLLTMHDKCFVATVTIESTDQLDFSETIWQLKDSFFENLSTVEILQDNLKKQTQESKQKFESLLKNMAGASADPIIRVNAFILLRKYSSNNSNKILSDFINDRTVPLVLKNAAIDLDTHNSKCHHFNMTFKFLKLQPIQLDLRKMLTNVYNESIEIHRDMLIRICPRSLPSLLSKLQQLGHSKIDYVMRADIDVFEQLATQPFFQYHKGHFENLVERFAKTFDKVTSHANPDPSSVIPIMSPLIEFLVRSLQEIAMEITEAAGGIDYPKTCDLGKWKIEKIKWPMENKSSFYHRSLEIQYNFICDMLRHILPDNRYKTLDYRFRVLEQDSSQQEGCRTAESWLQKHLLKCRKLGGLPERYKHLSEGRLVWLYLLDHTIHEVFKNSPKYQYILKQHDPLIEGYVRFIENAPSENHESFRALTHNVVRLIASSAPYTRATADKLRVNVDVDKLGVDVDILFQHISTASQNIAHDTSAFSNFRDLIAEYNKYLGLRESVKIEAAPGYFSIPLTQIMSTFMRTVELSLKKSVPTAALVVYFRYLNDFLDDFRNIDFLAMWYVKTGGYEDPESLEKVENKLSTGRNCSYRVSNIEKFVAEYYCPGFPPPRHYIIQIVNELLLQIQRCLDKQWQSEKEQLQIVQLKATGVLMDAIRRSFMYLKEQPDYVDFNAFKKESVEPFKRLVEECSTLNELKTRADIVKESFWYLRKMDEIDIDQALKLMREVNSGYVSNKLLNCYNLYLSNYNRYIEQYTSVIGAGHTEGLDAVKQILQQPTRVHFSQWTEQFKTEQIPILLAGLSAIWSILVSKDLLGTGKFLKPHCIQILCILRLLSVGQSKGVDKHLAQVLTGQGKSVILGLLSSILALTGHKVRVLCYSKYLSSRDQTDFEDLFRTFHITGNINYGTFEDMANDVLNPTINGIQKSLRQLVKDRVLQHADVSTMGSAITETKNTVLLIDEVDVFFTHHFYGNVYRSCERVSFTGMSMVQEYIWNLAKTGKSSQEIVNLTNAFMKDKTAARNELLSDLDAFLSIPGTFSLLTYESGDVLVKKRYTNQTLFDEHLLEMAVTAVSVANRQDDRTLRFNINDEGIICVKRSDNIYSEEWETNRLIGYRNTFSYFRLKGSNYDHKNFQNYGYLLLDTGIISYSLLPSQFRLILGVSGTLKNLGEYEKSGINSYNIRNTTILPSFYGETNLRFNKQTDFHYCTEELDWLRKLYNTAIGIVQSNRAVLIFFESDLTMDLFTKAYRSKFDRLNEITKNTQSHLRDAYIEEAGLPGAVTLATRGMGRGVDFKSSLSVEKHGGVHVIQSFYSADIKEEIQIKGRTARKDNKGSYEIVVCKEHLVRESIIQQHDQTAHNYATLDEIRQILSHEKGLTVNDKIKRSESSHKITMEYFGLA